MNVTNVMMQVEGKERIDTIIIGKEEKSYSG
jgi:hypothetical protein